MKEYKHKHSIGVMLCTEEDIKKIIKLYKEGYSLKYLSDEFPISIRTIKKILINIGITPRNLKQASLKREKHPKWKQGKLITKKGYVYIHSPEHPHAKKKGSSFYVPEHILKMEKKVKRYLTENEVVHHIDKNPSNNNIKNLKLYNKWNHTSYHSSMLKLKRDNKGRFLST